MSDEPETKPSDDESEGSNKAAKTPESEILDREKMLREELRGTIQTYMLVWRTGLAALPTLLVAIGFLRKDYLQIPGSALPATFTCKISNGFLTCAQGAAAATRGLTSIPFYQYLLGTTFLAGVAYLFYRLQRSIADRVLFFAIELNVKCKMLQPPYGPSDRGLWQSGLMAFPLLDLFVRVLLWLDEGVGGKWDLDTTHWIALVIELCICVGAFWYIRAEERMHLKYRIDKGLNRRPDTPLWEPLSSAPSPATNPRRLRLDLRALRRRFPMAFR